MALNKEKLEQLTKQRSADAIERAKARKENREWISMSQDIALGIHYYMRTAGVSQKELAERMGVSAVYVGKLLKGNENLTLETICKIQRAIETRIVSVAKPYRNMVIMSVSPIKLFSANAVKSDKFGVEQVSQEGYVLAAGEAA